MPFDPSTDSPPVPAYLAGTYEAIARERALYDETRDQRALVRGLAVACGQLMRFAQDSEFWDDIAPRALDAARDGDGMSLDDDLADLLEEERYLLMQTGMSSRYVAILLDDVETAIHAWEAASSNGDVIAAVDLGRLRSTVERLAGETCDRYSANERLLQPITKHGEQPPTVEEPHRLRKFLKRAGMVVGGGLIIAGDIVAGAHAVIDPTVVHVSAKAGFTLAVSGIVGREPG